MPNFFWLPLTTLFIGLMPSVLSNWPNVSSRLTQAGLALMGLLVIGLSVHLPFNQVSTWTLFAFHGVTLRLVIGLDMLTRFLLIFIFFISFIIYSYARNYLLSDTTRLRFLVQFSLVISSVVLLAMSMNLFTAFVAWQFIGINLYLLLNHYHNDPAANKAAKKKFIINRLGDASFLLAIVIAYQTQNTTLFASMQPDGNTWLICSLIFISVMTKSAQFPFHIWLPDTMEAPTPVSALMHAGVINAGAILLTRMSSLMIPLPMLCLMITIIGLLTALIGTAWMQQQSDVKRQLAYSTMGQMGYMIMQCGLGAFPAAIFHLMAHGFFKASLFLNAGSTLTLRHDTPCPKAIFIPLLLAHGATAILIVAAYQWANWLNMPLPLLIWGFIALTILSILYRAACASSRWATIGTAMLFCLIGLGAYITFIHFISRALAMNDFHSPLSTHLQGSLFVLIYIIQLLCWTPWWKAHIHPKSDRVEAWMRAILLNPLRQAGERLNELFYAPKRRYLGYLILVLSLGCLITGLLNTAHHFLPSTSHHAVFVLALTLIVLTAITANRNQSLRALLFWLSLFEINFINIALFEPSQAIQRIALFHLINMMLVLGMMIIILLRSEHMDVEHHHYPENKLPWRLFYLGAALLLIIGIPGTAAFVTEFYILNALLQHSVIAILVYLTSIILLSIVIMHTLQLYVFDTRFATQLAKPIKPVFHMLFIVMITVNIICGIDPTLLLHWLAR